LLSVGSLGPGVFFFTFYFSITAPIPNLGSIGVAFMLIFLEILTVVAGMIALTKKPFNAFLKTRAKTP
jgi:hypothetical protein